ncbi:glycosyltransferase involved in cell wall biosynthesis [Silvibacterium bohemicum]|uniref:Glycosyltransferase involved in cell wall biosynthesis n=1 Tax=Silvibacterium bohemicum TaxID=1577686 RepID=A0A841JQY4_9BACT|nr:glycosyltransferase family 4 protein [Silvibacterium bohemicum]MBB6143803.1 glycosyltransferase involved in cell wall biosynthesis [Silvibacterium bohemicum]
MLGIASAAITVAGRVGAMPHAGILHNGETAVSCLAETHPLPLPTRIAVIGNYLPRQCGIATFTTDLCAAIAMEYGNNRLFAIPVNDPESRYQYPERVRIELEQDDYASYVRVAEFLNFNSNDLVCLQHEYGIFGGVAGSYILALLRKLKMPLVTTLHTVLREPDSSQRAVLEEIAHLSDRLIVMSEHAVHLLRDVYDVPGGKIDLIPHGVPDLTFMDPNYFKDQFGTEGKFVLLTFGLLSPNKGIENVIRALPAILKKHENLVYIVSGATHPHIRRREGERYREELQALAVELGVASHVIFNNRFVSAEELVEHVGAADLYITPYRQEAQVVSGTLAIALGAGKAIISTPYWHAKELLADGRGVLVPFDDPGSIAEAAIRLLDNDAERHAMRKRAYLHSRGTTWQKTAQAYMASFQRARRERSLRPRAAPQDIFSSTTPTDSLPQFDTTHLSNMTDDTGILQHAIFTVPNSFEGYTTDDNARALIVTTLLNESILACRSEYTALSRRYLAFLWLAFHGETGRFRNFLSYDRKWLEKVGSEDSHGRALWALGTVFCHSQDAGLRGAAGRLFEAAVPVALTFTSPRAWAFSVLGMQAYLDCFPGDRLIQGTRNTLANLLLDVYERTHSPTWDWFEKSLSYSNARLPQALLVAGSESDNKRMVEAGCDSLRWLVAEQRRGDVFMPIGSRGFFTQGGEKASFDQQPVEACGTISACLQAYRITNEDQWLEEAWRAFRWFLGKNDLEVPLYDPTTGGCRDGLHPDRVNENQGAESTLSFLMALLEMQGMEMPTAKEQHQEMSVSL